MESRTNRDCYSALLPGTNEKSSGPRIRLAGSCAERAQIGCGCAKSGPVQRKAWRHLNDARAAVHQARLVGKTSLARTVQENRNEYTSCTACRCLRSHRNLLPWRGRRRQCANGQQRVCRVEGRIVCRFTTAHTNTASFIGATPIEHRERQAEAALLSHARTKSVRHVRPPYPLRLAQSEGTGPFILIGPWQKSSQR